MNREDRAKATGRHRDDQFNADMARRMRDLAGQTTGGTAREYERRARDFDRKGGR